MIGLDGHDHHWAVLAEMITSKKIGLAHVRLIGELLVADADLNQWLYEVGKRTLSEDEWVRIAERVIECEETYQNVWQEVNRADTVEELSGRLPGLERALEEAVQQFRSLRG